MESGVATTTTTDRDSRLLLPAPALRLLLVGANPRPAEFVGQLLDAGTFQVIGTAADGVAALVQARKLQPDVVLLDVQLPGMDGLATLSLLRMELPEVQVVMLTDVADEETVCEALRRGASGYLLKSMSTTELIWQLHSLTTGNLALAPEIALRLLRRITSLEQHDSKKHNEDPDPRTLLTPRQLKVLMMLSHGYAYKEVGQILGFSVPTIKREVAAAVKQLQVRHRREALALVRRYLVFPFYQRKNLAS